ncbi:DUF3488 and DUF4129 domain-containing transglutaminase family protein [Microbulbifer sp. TYP-18]|uniref:DUF3488 and DUF4129 domain-containing transglutaminase family protein n=1 Tax=Microbulbifer sp. TYP-18 TaxID=3230024 RepID=UPI0034C6A9AB
MNQIESLLPRESLLWIFAAQLAVLTPHFLRLPGWLVAAWVLAVLWRLDAYRGRRELPGRLAKYMAVGIVAVGLLSSYRHWFALEPMVALLAIALTLKNLELVSRRDAFLSLLLSYFVAATLFIFDQSIPVAVYGVLSILVVTAALAAQCGRHSARPRRALGLAAALLAQSVPLMLVLFVVIPRLGPLWAVPQDSGEATTGISDSMTPGDFSRLSKSDEPALRISFDGPVPPPEQRYWRGLVLSRFDGRSWGRYPGFGSGDRGWGQPRPTASQLPAVGPRYRYQVIQEPTHKPWLFALARPHSDTGGVGETRDDRLVKSTPVYSRFAYQVRSWPRSTLPVQEVLNTTDRRRNLQLPRGGNPRARAWAAQLREKNLSPQQVSQQILDLFTRSFIYTLQPPALGADSVDEFLFDSRQGFCEHFAGSYVFMMRAAGIPARVVAGYQGGEWVARQEYLLVRDYDAHAWAEIWIPARGWQRVDPTAAVSPERIRDGLQRAAADEFMRDALLPLHRIALLHRLRLEWDMLNYRWYQTVISFDSDRQRTLLQRILGEISPARLALLLAIPAAVALSILLLWIWSTGREQKLPEAQRLYRNFCRRLARAGIGRRCGEAPRDFARRVAAEEPGLGPMADKITSAFEMASYAEDPRAGRQLRRLLRSFRPRRR